MKPNDKAYQAAIAEGKRWGKNLIRKENQIPSWKVLRQSDEQYGYDVIAEFNNHEDCDEALERLRAEAMVDAAYAAQFKSEDYAGLIERLLDFTEICEGKNNDARAAAADALEAVLAERDAAIEERDALAARLAPVEDEALVEIVDGIIYTQAVRGTDTDEIARAAIAAVRPHIEAAERERCAKKLDEACELLHKLTAIIPGNDGAGEEVAKFLRSATIRSGK